MSIHQPEMIKSRLDRGKDRHESAGQQIILYEVQGQYTNTSASQDDGSNSRGRAHDAFGTKTNGSGCIFRIPKVAKERLPWLHINESMVQCVFGSYEKDWTPAAPEHRQRHNLLGPISTHQI